MGAFDKEFNQAKERLNTLKEDPGNDVKLKMYALFKQVLTETQLNLRMLYKCVIIPFTRKPESTN